MPISISDHPVTADVASTLLVRPVSRSDESVSGFKLRLAYLNGINPLWLNPSAETDSTRRGYGLACWCPVCISGSDSHWRSSWEMAGSACFEHECWLSEQCPGCCHQMSWRRARFTQCACGQDLRNVESASFSPQIKALLRNEQPGDLSDLYRLSKIERWNLARAVGALDAFGLRGKPFKKASSRSPGVARDIIDRGANILLSDGGCSFLHRLRLSTPRSNVPLTSEVFPGLLVSLRKNLGPNELNWMLALLDRYVEYAAEQSSPVIWESRQRASEKAGGSVASRKPRARSIVTTLSAQGKTPHVRRTKTGRTKVAITDAEWRETQERDAEFVGIKRAARRFELSAPRLRALIEAGLVRGEDSRVNEQSIARFVGMILERSRPLDKSSSNLVVPLTHVLRSLVPLHRTSDLFNRIVDESIPTYFDGRTAIGIDSLFIRETDLAMLASPEVHARSARTIVEAARMLCLKDEVMYHLVNIGLIAATTEQRNRRNARVIADAEIRRFSNTVETLASACRCNDIPLRVGLAWARENGRQLVSGPTIDGGRQYFVRRVEIGLAASLSPPPFPEASK